MKKTVFTYLLAFVVLVAFVVMQASFFISMWFLNVDKRIDIVGRPEYQKILKEKIDEQLTEYASYCDCPAELLTENVSSEQIAAYQISELEAIYMFLRGRAYVPATEINLDSMQEAVRLDTIQYCNEHNLVYDEKMGNSVSEIISGARQIISDTAFIFTVDTLETSEFLAPYVNKIQSVVVTILRTPWICCLVIMLVCSLMFLPLKNHKIRMLFWMGSIVFVAAIILGIMGLVLLFDNPASRLALDMPQVTYTVESLVHSFTYTLLVVEGVLFIVGGVMMGAYYSFREKKKHGNHHRTHNEIKASK